MEARRRNEKKRSDEYFTLSKGSMEKKSLKNLLFIFLDVVKLIFFLLFISRFAATKYFLSSALSIFILIETKYEKCLLRKNKRRKSREHWLIKRRKTCHFVVCSCVVIVTSSKTREKICLELPLRCTLFSINSMHFLLTTFPFPARLCFPNPSLKSAAKWDRNVFIHSVGKFIAEFCWKCNCKFPLQSVSSVENWAEVYSNVHLTARVWTLLTSVTRVNRTIRPNNRFAMWQ